MDPETISAINDLLSNPTVIYGSIATIVGVTGVTGIVGYIMGKNKFAQSLEAKTIEKEMSLEKQRTKQAQIAVEKIDAENEVKLKELKYEHAGAEHERDLEYLAAKEEHKRTRASALYEHDQAMKRLGNEKRYKIEETKKSIADAFAELKPMLEQYLGTLLEQMKVDPELQDKRDKYRGELVDEFIEKVKSSKGNVLMQDHYKINGKLLQRVNVLVDAKYPLPQVDTTVPKPLKNVINFLTK